MSKLRILVIEDKQHYIEAAKVQLGDHDVTICTSYSQAEEVLAGSDNHWYKPEASFPFDVVLTDLFLPVCPIGTCSCVQHYESKESVIRRDTPIAVERFGAEIPYGIVLAMVALRRGVPVAIVSDKSHHGHPISWTLDLLGFDYSPKKVKIGGLDLICSGGMVHESGKVSVKNWKSALEQLMAK